MTTKGFVELPDQRIGHTIPEAVFYFYNDKYTRAMPRKKDFVSVRNTDTGKKEHKQERLVLCNLKGLFVKFHETHAEICTLQPKWFIPVNSAGTHPVCLCIYHQNVHLLIDACAFDKDYHQMTEMIVCRRQK